MDPNWGQGGGPAPGPVRSGGFWNTRTTIHQGPYRHRGRGSSGWYRTRNPNDNYYPPRTGNWNNQRPNQPYYRTPNPYRPGGFRGRPQFYSTPYVHPPRHMLKLNQTNIDNWISPKMWEDPWADLMQRFDPPKPIPDPTSVSCTPTPSSSKDDPNLSHDAVQTSNSLTSTVLDLQPSDDEPAKLQESKEESKVQNNSPATEELQDSRIGSPPAKRPHIVTYETLETFPE